LVRFRREPEAGVTRLVHPIPGHPPYTPWRVLMLNPRGEGAPGAELSRKPGLHFGGNARLLVPPIPPEFVSAASGIRDGAKLIGFFWRIVLIIPLLCAEVLAALARRRTLAGSLARHALDLGKRNSGYRRSKLDGAELPVATPPPNRDATYVNMFGEFGLREIGRAALAAFIGGGRIAHRDRPVVGRSGIFHAV